MSGFDEAYDLTTLHLGQARDVLSRALPRFAESKEESEAAGALYVVRNELDKALDYVRALGDQYGKTGEPTPEGDAKQPIHTPSGNLNDAQLSGIAGVEEQLERAYALISGAQSWLRDFPDDAQLTKEGLVTPHLLLDMAAEETGDRKCLNRIQEGAYR